MHKTTQIVFSIGFLMFSFSSNLNAETFFIQEKSNSKKVIVSNSLKMQDVNLLKGNWQREGTVEEIQINEVLNSGLLKVNFSNGKQTTIEKAGWVQATNVLRVFVLFAQDDQKGYSFTLNYVPEKDVLVGVYEDGSDKKTQNVIFLRNK